ncbi:MAG: response regulator [Treponema sp.]|nr:response regulator [Treponema sp.]
MKKVLIADSHPLFRDFLKQKLSEDQIEVITTQENRDIYTRVLSTLPNLIILDMEEESEMEMEFLEKKLHDTNCADIPVIITGPKQDRANIAAFAKYGVIKYFEKPVQFDLFFKSIGYVVHVPLTMDTTPCILDLHRNNNIIFVEIALGLNREKIALLQFKLSEMIQREEIDNPKIVLMLSNLELSFMDGYNLEFLIDNVLACPKVHTKNVKILSLSNFVQELINGHSDYEGIEITSNLSRVLTDIVDTSITSDVSDLITNKFLTPSYEAQDTASIATRFSSDVSSDEVSEKTGSVISIAIIDSDEASLDVTKTYFEQIGASCYTCTNGPEFLKNYEDGKFDLIILDVLLQDQTGLSLLKTLHSKPHSPPIVVYSPSLQKDIVVKVLSAGAASYLVKPQKQNILIQKCLAILKTKE